MQQEEPAMHSAMKYVQAARRELQRRMQYFFGFVVPMQPLQQPTQVDQRVDVSRLESQGFPAAGFGLDEFAQS